MRLDFALRHGFVLIILFIIIKYSYSYSFASEVRRSDNLTHSRTIRQLCTEGTAELLMTPAVV